MKILFTIGTLGGGGAERNVALLANEFIKLGHEVGVMTIWGDEMVYTLNENVKYIPLNPKGKKKLTIFLKQVSMIRPNIKKYNPDIVVSFLADVNAFVLLMTRFLGCKVIVSERNDPHIDPTIKPFRILRKLAYPFADGYIFQTEDAKEYFNRTIKGKKATVIVNPVRADLPMHRVNRSKVITSACRLTEQKNIPMMINAFKGIHKLYPEYELHIYGEGTQREKLQQYIDDNELTNYVKLMGFSPNVCDRINESEMFVLSSDYEGMSNSMLEALAMGVPSIVTDCPIGGARMMIQDSENGILVPVGETGKMMLAMQKLIEDEALRSKISQNALQVRNTNSIVNITQKWMQFINDVMGES